MKTKSSNPDFTTEKIRQIIDFVRPSGISKFEVWVKSAGRPYLAGRAYTHGCSYSGKFAPYVVARIGKLRFPYKTTDRGAYLGATIYTLDEALVFLLAHELRHVWQKKIKKGYRVWGSKGQYSERDADAYAIHKLREWRRK